MFCSVSLCWIVVDHMLKFCRTGLFSDYLEMLFQMKNYCACREYSDRSVYCVAENVVTTAIFAVQALTFGRVMITRNQNEIQAAQFLYGATREHSWLRHCSTNQKVAGSIPAIVIRIFSLT